MNHHRVLADSGIALAVLLIAINLVFLVTWQHGMLVSLSNLGLGVAFVTARALSLISRPPAQPHPSNRKATQWS